MSGIMYNPFPKLSVLYKCRDCGYKIKLLCGLFSKKCPCCGGKNVRVTVGLTERKRNPFIFS